MKSDEVLMLDYCEGDSGCFDLLYRRYKTRVYAYITKRAPAHAVDDLFQQVFLKLHEKKHLYDSSYAFAPWFFTLCRHTIVDHLRKKSEQAGQFESWEEDLHGSKQALVDQGEADQNPMDLPPMEAQAFALLYQKFVEGKGYKELEEEFKAKPATLRKRVERLLHALRQEN